MTQSVEVLVGRIGKPHGLRGDVTIDVRTDSPEVRFAPGAHLRATPGTAATQAYASLEVASSRWHQGVLLARFSGFDGRTAAESLRGTLLHVDLDTSEAPSDPEEFYDHQLTGLAVRDLEGAHLGEIRDVVHGAAQDLLAVRTPDGRDALVPFVAALVPEVDLGGGFVVVADRPGLVAPFPDDIDDTDDTPATGA